MTTYNTYQEAKIANPNEDIYMNEIGQFQPDTNSVLRTMKCNPAYHCMTVEKFLADGNKFIEGDLIINTFGSVNKIRDDEELRNKLVTENNNSRYILRAAALENIPAETPEEKEVLDGIGSAGEVEWKNGDECVYRHQPDVTYMFVGIHPVNKKSAICWNEKEGIAQIHIDFISKPETTQQREDREKLEFIREMCFEVGSVKVNQASALYEAGYRKEKING